MGPFTLILSLVFIGIYVALFVKLWIMTNDVEIIKKKLSQDNEVDFSAIFYAYILAGQTEKAKSILFEEISKDSEYKALLKSSNEIYVKKQSEVLNKKYDSYLSELKMGNTDFTRIAKF